MAAKVTVTIDRSRVAARIKAGKMAMVSAVAEQALSDCNYFAKRDQGTLIESSQTASDVENGQLVWDTPYARRQYYTGAPSLEQNPNASILWCEEAHDHFGQGWQQIAQKSFAKGMG